VTLTLRREQSKACITPLRVIRKGGAYPVTLCPYLTVAVCGPVGVAVPLGEAWRSSKGEQHQSRGSATYSIIHMR
jgi:hypothetical protein